MNPPLTLRRGLRDICTVFAGNIAAGISILVGLKLLTLWLSQAAYGRYVLALSISSIATQLLYGPLAASVMRCQPDARACGLSGACAHAIAHLLVRFSRTFVAVGAATAAGWILLRCLRGMPPSGEDYATVALSIAIGTSCGIINVFEGFFSAEHRRELVALSCGLGQLARNGFAIFGAISGSPTVALGGYLIGTLLQWLILARLFKAPLQGHTQDRNRILSWATELIRYSRPFLIWGLPQALLVVADRWSLALARDAREVGIYAAALQIVQQPTNFAFAGLLLFAGPRIFSAISMRDDAATASKIHRSLLFTALVLCGFAGIVCLMLPFVANQLLTLLTNEQYHEANALLVPIFLSAFTMQLGQWFALKQLGHRQPERLLAPKVFSGIVGVALALSAAFLWGAVGVAWTGIITSLLYTGWVIRDAVTWSSTEHHTSQ